MKLFASVLLLLLLDTKVNAQSYDEPRSASGVAMGLLGGISSRESVIGTLTVGAMIKAKTHLSINMIVLAETRNPESPAIFEVRAGHVFNRLEVYGGLGYHIAGADDKLMKIPTTGFKPAYGIIKYFNNSPWIVGAGMSGRIFSLQVGLFGIR